MFHTLCVLGKRIAIVLSCLFLGGLVLSSGTAWAQTSLIAIESSNKPLPSLLNVAEAARATSPVFTGGLVHVPNFLGSSRTQIGGFQGPDEVLQDFVGPNLANVLTGFEGSSNDDNLAVLGFGVVPPDTNGDVSSSHYVQMVNLITTVFDKNGNVVAGGEPFPTNTLWAGVEGICALFNQGDPVVLYDETNGRWLVSQFAFDEIFTTFSHCIAVSWSDDPLGGYNRYEFSFDGLGLPDYPKHGIVTDSITMTANLFAPPFFFFSGTFLAAIDKYAMYNSEATVTMLFSNLGCSLFSPSCEFGFLPADLDDPVPGTAGFVPALFATAMSRPRRFDIWKLTVNWNQPDPLVGASLDRDAEIRISAFDSDLCGAPREACIPQPNGAPELEAITDRLMHRLQIREFGKYRSMVASHTVDGDGSGTAGIRWYEMRQNLNNGRWSKYQEGTYAPADGLHRWMPSIAMNAAGDIGLGVLVSSDTVPMGMRTTGQTAASSGTGTMDGGEEMCRQGVTEQTGASRSGDYGSISVDPVTDTFWNTNEYGQNNVESAGWGTFVCEFEVTAADGGDGGGGGGACPGLGQSGDSCTEDSDCCSNNCRGRPGNRTCK